MKLELKEKDDPIVFWAFMRVLSGLEDGANMAKAIDEYHANNRVVDIQLLINGKEFDFGVMIHRYAEAMESMVQQRAFELMQEKLGESSQHLHKIQRHLEEAEQNIRKTLGIPDDEED